MQVTDCTAKNPTSSETDPAAVIQSLQQEIGVLKQQLDWYKRQLFGRKSEKRIIEHPDQLDLSALLGETPPPAEPEPTEEITYHRRKPKQRSEDDVTDSGLRFGPDVPVEVIELSAPQLEGPEADQYEVIDHKISRRLAQRPGSYVVLEYRRPVLRHKPSSRLMEVPAPSAVFEGSLADISLLAGLLVDKFCYHLPLYRQHQRLKDVGITLSRSTLNNYTQRAIELLLNDAYVDLVGERIDVSIRLGTLSDSSYIARRVSIIRYYICASPEYLKTHGTPDSPQALARYECLLFPRGEHSLNWLFRYATGDVEEVQIHGRCLITNSESIRQCALSGMGLALLPDWLVEPDIESGKLQTLFNDYEVTATDYDSAIWILQPSRAYVPLKAKVFVAHLLDRCSISVKS